MITRHRNVELLVPYVERVEIDAVGPVGEPGDGSISWQRVVRVEGAGFALTITFMAEEAELLERL